MKPYLFILSLLCCVAMGTAQAAPRGGGGMPGMGAPSPRITKAMEKLFGENSAYTATVELEQAGMKMPGKIAFDQGKARFEMDLSKASNPGMGADGAAQMKAMGMDRITAISRPDKKVSYMIYPSMEAYFESPIPDPQASAAGSDDYKVEVTELGKETLDGRQTVKNKVVVTDDKGSKYEATVWNAKELKNFPVKIEHNQEGARSTMVFKDVKLSKPEASQFDPPANYKKYASMQELMQQEIMKRMGMPGGMPPGAMPPGGVPPGKRKQ